MGLGDDNSKEAAKPKIDDDTQAQSRLRQDADLIKGESISQKIYNNTWFFGYASDDRKIIKAVSEMDDDEIKDHRSNPSKLRAELHHSLTTEEHYEEALRLLNKIDRGGKPTQDLVTTMVVNPYSNTQVLRDLQKEFKDNPALREQLHKPAKETKEQAEFRKLFFEVAEKKFKSPGEEQAFKTLLETGHVPLEFLASEHDWSSSQSFYSDIANASPEDRSKFVKDERYRAKILNDERKGVDFEHLRESEINHALLAAVTGQTSGSSESVLYRPLKVTENGDIVPLAYDADLQTKTLRPGMYEGMALIDGAARSFSIYIPKAIENIKEDERTSLIGFSDGLLAFQRNPKAPFINRWTELCESSNSVGIFFHSMERATPLNVLPLTGIPLYDGNVHDGRTILDTNPWMPDDVRYMEFLKNMTVNNTNSKIDPERFHLVSFSDGASTTLAYLKKHENNDKVKGSALVCPSLFDTTSVPKNVSTLVVLGGADERLPVDGIRRPKEAWMLSNLAGHYNLANHYRSPAVLPKELAICNGGNGIPKVSKRTDDYEISSYLSPNGVKTESVFLYRLPHQFLGRYIPGEIAPGRTKSYDTESVTSRKTGSQWLPRSVFDTVSYLKDQSWTESLGIRKHD